MSGLSRRSLFALPVALPIAAAAAALPAPLREPPRPWVSGVLNVEMSTDFIPPPQVLHVVVDATEVRQAFSDLQLHLLRVGDLYAEKERQMWEWVGG